MAVRLVAWRGVDPARVEAARVRLAADHLEATGTSATADHVVTYRLRTGPGWTTRSLDVEVAGDGWTRGLALTRADDGAWSAAWTGDGVDGLSLPGGGALDGALDVDLAHCPLTNTMPILRHGLLDADPDRAPVDLVMAWVAVPELTVHASPQRYAPSDRVHLPGGGALVRFASEGFATTIEVDGDGLAVTYPGLAYRLPGIA
jgi:hypothetical protein